MTKKMTQDEWVARARSVHGDRYDYSKSVYQSIRGRLIVVCPIHGDFETTYMYHIYRKSGCPRCAVEARSKALTGRPLRLSTEIFIRRARAIHGDQYDYSQSEYCKAELPLTVICPKHGPFTTSHVTHVLRGKGCPRCSAERRGLAMRKVKGP